MILRIKGQDTKKELWLSVNHDVANIIPSVESEYDAHTLAVGEYIVDRIDLRLWEIQFKNKRNGDFEYISNESYPEDLDRTDYDKVFEFMLERVGLFPGTIYKIVQS